VISQGAKPRRDIIVEIAQLPLGDAKYENEDEIVVPPQRVGERMLIENREGSDLVSAGQDGSSGQDLAGGLLIRRLWVRVPRGPQTCSSEG
jgi:hypothetical protein